VVRLTALSSQANPLSVQSGLAQGSAKSTSVQGDLPHSLVGAVISCHTLAFSDPSHCILAPAVAAWCHCSVMDSGMTR